MTSKMVARSWSTSGSTGDKLLTGRSDELRDTGLIVLRQRVSDVERRCKKEWEKLEGKWGELEDSMRLMKYDAEKTGEKVTESLGEAAEELKKGYEKFRERLTKPLK